METSCLSYSFGEEPDGFGVICRWINCLTVLTAVLEPAEKDRMEELVCLLAIYGHGISALEVVNELLINVIIYWATVDVNLRFGTKRARHAVEHSSPSRLT